MDFGLGAVPFGEGFDGTQIFGVSCAPFASGTQRVFKPVQPRQIFDDEIRIGTECVTVIEVVQPVVAQLVAGNADSQRHNHQGTGP